jgi:la-related protein 1
VDNLCKDLFLRKHMDSQGFVMLNFIANFKRIRNLTEDFDLLRHCSRQLRNAEYQFGEDGIDRLRPREKWEQWVLAIEQRDPSAQTDGPPPAKTYSFADDNVAVPFANGSIQDVSQTSANAIPNGTTEHSVPRRSLSSMAPEFTPFVPVGVQNESANVGKPNYYNVFPDDQVENLVIVVREPGSYTPPQQHLLSHSPRALSSRFVDGSKTAGGSVTSDEKPVAPPNGGTSAGSFRYLFSILSLVRTNSNFLVAPKGINYDKIMICQSY